MISRTALFLLAVVNLSFGQGTPDSDALMRLEDMHLTAAISRDRVALLKLHDDNFHGVIASGLTVDKMKMVDLLETGSPHIVLSHEEVKATVYGDIGITTGKVLHKSKSGTIIGQSRYLRIYQRKGGEWKIIESQATVIVHQ